ncbi:MAG: class II aldolase/adducin family protein [Treponema sp.]|jgi:rhamnose utilization protein RhaD (predicted bifunctional aldolase and dehydrogenase)|nr:class II aldolase/adducin family protein [Treponema sp.]
MSIEALVELSRFYGTDPEYILAGGGNTSWKDGGTLYVKSSGTSLAEASPDTFVKVDRKALALIWDKKYPESSAERESAVLSDIMAARCPGEEQKRPSVETLLHDMLPFAFIAHLHPALVNGVTCSRQGEAAMREMFGKEPIWIPSVNPGYILSRLVKTAMDAYREEHQKSASVIFLQNHGIFAGAANVDGIKEQFSGIMDKIGARTKRKPGFSGLTITTGSDTAGAIASVLGVLTELSGSAAFMGGGEIAAFVKDSSCFAPVSSAFTPDHIVYSGSDPLFTEASDDAGIRHAWEAHVQKTGRKPKIIAVKDLGIFSAASTEKAACFALDLFRDTVKIAVYADSFGGPFFMTQEQIDFINNWEAERFRSRVSAE